MHIDVDAAPPSAAEINAARARLVRITVILGAVCGISIVVMNFGEGIAMPIASITFLNSGVAHMFICNDDRFGRYKPILPDDCDRLAMWVRRSESIEQYIGQVNRQRRQLVGMEFDALRRLHEKEVHDTKKASIYKY